MQLIHKRVKLLGTILCKDEEDILPHMIEHHIAKGVEAFIITNNRSKDRTKEIASSYKEVVKIFDTEDTTHNQELHVTRMAHYAEKLKPEWIIHFDADEFWNGFDFLDTVQTNGVASTTAYIHPPVKSNFGFNPIEQKFYLDLKELQTSVEETKILHKPSKEVIIHHGNHWMDNIGEILKTDKIYRHHYPLRNYSQLINKAIRGHEAMISRGMYCGRWGNWYNLYQEGNLKKEFDKVVNNWKEMSSNKIIKKNLLKEMISFYAGGPEGLDRVIKGLEYINPEIKEWIPCKAQ